MLRRFMPAISVILAVMLDTAIIPIFYNGRYSLMLSLIVVLLIAILRGRMLGMLYGMIAGLMIDIPTGTMGMKLFAFIAIGFTTGFLLDHQPDLYDTSKNIKRTDRNQYLLVRLIWICALLFVYEIVMLTIQYFSNAVLEWTYFRDILIRVMASGLLALALTPFFHWLYIGKGDAERAKGHKTREVKDY